jgi:hypothetical protein
VALQSGVSTAFDDGLGYCETRRELIERIPATGGVGIGLLSQPISLLEEGETAEYR